MGETIVIYKVVKKTPESYKFVSEGRAGNPVSLHPDNQVPSEPHGTTIKGLPDGFCKRILNEDAHALELIKTRAREQGVFGLVKIKRAMGGVGRIWPSTKMNIRSGALNTKNSGFKLLCEMYI